MINNTTGKSVFKGTGQQTVSVNICSEDILSPTVIFGLKCDEKLEFSFRDMGEGNAYCFRRNKNDVLGKKKGQNRYILLVVHTN